MSTAENLPPLAAVVAEREHSAAGGRRHPAQVSADRLHEHADKYAQHLTPRELAAITAAVVALDQIPARIRQSGDVE